MAFTRFDLSFSQDSEGFWEINIYDEDGEWYAQVWGKDFKEMLHHALHYADPLLAAAVYPLEIEWTEDHKVTFSYGGTD